MVRLIQRHPGWQAKLLAILVIAVDISVLIYFKYIVFLVSNASVLVRIFGSQVEGNVLDIKPSSIPPGISFYTFQMVGFVVDSLNQSKQHKIKFIDYLNFASFFPQVVAGPIERRSDLLPQLESWQIKLSIDNFEKGLQWGVLGFFMKFVLADNIARLVDPLLSTTDNPWLIILSTYLFGFRIYYDFAGYSFIALGIAKVLGINLTINFLAPYTAADIQDFWRRWHVTLSSWFRDYIYIPLGGSRVRWALLNLLAVFAISGLWHGAGWNFVMWGTFHGMLLVIHRLVTRRILIPSIVGWFLTFASVMFSWIFFMNPDLSNLLLKLNTIFDLSTYTIEMARHAYLSFNLISRFVLVFLLVTAHLSLFLEYLNVWRFKTMPYTTFVSPWFARILLPLTIWLAAKGASEFIYFEF